MLDSLKHLKTLDTEIKDSTWKDAKKKAGLNKSLFKRFFGKLTGANIKDKIKSLKSEIKSIKKSSYNGPAFFRYQKSINSLISGLKEFKDSKKMQKEVTDPEDPLNKLSSLIGEWLKILNKAKDEAEVLEKKMMKDDDKWDKKEKQCAVAYRLAKGVNSM